MIKLVTTLVLALAVTVSHAQEAAPVAAPADELTANLTGFATYTWVQQEGWFPSGGAVAINAAAHYGPWALKAQLANNDVIVRRAQLEYSGGSMGRNLTVQLGRIPRLNTLFSDVYGNPAEWDVAVLPLSTYNRRKVHSLAFNALDGIKVIGDYNEGKLGLRGIVDYGRGIQENSCEWQIELTRRPCMPGWDFTGATGAFDLSLEARIGTAWTVMASYSSVLLDSVLNDPRDRRAMFYAMQYAHGLDYRFGRLSVRYAAPWGYLQAEHGEGRVWLHQPPRGWVLNSTAWDDYFMGGWYATDALTIFAGYAVGHARNSVTTSRDRFVGAVYRMGRWSHTAELHDGQGSWQRANSWQPEWRSVVLATTYSW